MALGAFAGGLARGFEQGQRLGLEMEEAEERKKDRELARRQAELGLETSRIQLDRLRQEQADENEWRETVRNFAFDPQLTEDAAGNVTVGGYKPKPNVDMMELGKLRAQFLMNKGKLGPEAMFKLAEMGKKAEQENAFKAWNVYRNTGDLNAAIAEANKGGNIKLVSAQAVPRKMFGIDYEAIVGTTEDGKQVVLDPFMAGFASAPLEYIKLAHKEREIGAAEKTASAAEQKALAAQTQANAALLNAQTNEQVRKALMARAGEKGKLTDDEMFDAAYKLYGSTFKETQDGRSIRVPTNISPFIGDIVSRSKEIAEGGVSPLIALDRASREIRERVSELESNLGSLFEAAANAGSKRMDILAKGITEALNQGAKPWELKEVARSLGRDPRLIDQAINYARSKKPDEKQRGADLGVRKNKPGLGDEQKRGNTGGLILPGQIGNTLGGQTVAGASLVAPTPGTSPLDQFRYKLGQ
jgi:hypothetical protein